jgi:hypothetical protein
MHSFTIFCFVKNRQKAKRDRPFFIYYKRFDLIHLGFLDLQFYPFKIILLSLPTYKICTKYGVLNF